MSGRDLVDWHFGTWSYRGHPNHRGLRLAVSLLGERPANILETGTSAWGTDSTRLWDAYVLQFGGAFWSVDLSPERRLRLLRDMSFRTHLEVSDSVEFLEQWVEGHAGDRANLVYLDSWDVDWQDPLPSAAHGLAEWRAVLPALGQGSVIVIDDTPKGPDWLPESERTACVAFHDDVGVWPGKGALVLKEIAEDDRFEILWHEYNVVIRAR